MDYDSQREILRLVTVVETPAFIACADKLLTPEEHDALVLYLAANPTAGDRVPGTDGIRKLRWALAGRGKRGGARVDLSAAERNEFRSLTKILVETYGKART